MAIQAAFGVVAKGAATRHEQQQEQDESIRSHQHGSNFVTVPAKQFATGGGNQMPFHECMDLSARMLPAGKVPCSCGLWQVEQTIRPEASGTIESGFAPCFSSSRDQIGAGGIQQPGDGP